MVERQTGGWVDGTVEQVGRWTASRWSRRSFLGRLGRLGVLVAGGTGMATLLAGRAEARVCGQSGVAPKCETFTCDATWGWCWYASGCCANGALKKICDCCAPNTPHPVGYCPSGTRVLCIMESCGADPRVMTKPVVVHAHADPVALAVEASRRRFRVRTLMAVVGDAEDTLFAALAASVGSVVAGPVLLTGRNGLAGTVAEELSRVGVRFVKLVGPHLTSRVDEALRARGMVVERIGSSEHAGQCALEVAAWSRELTGARTVIVLDSHTTTATAGPAAALANALRVPLVFGAPVDVAGGLEYPRPLHQAYVVTRDASRAQALPGARALTAGSVAGWAAELAGILLQRSGATGLWGALAPADDHLAAAAVAAVGGPVLRYEPSSPTVAGAGDWLLSHRERLDGLEVAGDRRALTAQAEWWLQGTLNVFELHMLRGGPGEGLPVIPQPRHERPLGRARWG